MSFRALVEKSPAGEAARYVHAPAHSPAVAHRAQYTNNQKNKPKTNYCCYENYYT